MNQYALERAVNFTKSWLRYQSRQGKLSGLSVQVRIGGKTVLSESYGWADTLTERPTTSDTLYSIGSQAKVLTSLALLALEKQGMLALDDAAVAYLPWLTDHQDKRVWAITLRQLLWHGSGLRRDGHPADFWQLFEPFPTEARLQHMVLASTLVSDPGARFKYSNLGYALLGQVIEKVSGKPYAHYVTTNILTPLEAKEIIAYSSLAPPTALATGYLRALETVRTPVQLFVPAHTYTAVAGWYATAGAMTHLLHRICSTPNEQTPAHHSHRGHWQPEAIRGTEYGWGFMPYEHNGRQLTGHTGSFIGHATYCYHDKATAMTVAVFANTKDAPVSQIAEGIFDTFSYFDTYAPTPTSPEVNRFNIRLANMWQIIEVVATNEQIVIIDPDDWSPFETIIEKLEHTDETSFTIVAADDVATLFEEVKFYFTPDGHTVEWVDYAGSKTLPLQQYRKWLATAKKTATPRSGSDWQTS